MTLNIIPYFWLSLSVLAAGSLYLIIEGYRVHRLFAESIVGRLVKTLVAVLIIELYSLGIVCFAFMTFYKQGVWVVFPVLLLWIILLGFAIAAVRSAKKQVSGLVK